MNKSPFNKSKAIAIGSLIFLFAFLAYWNYNNYKQEKVEMLTDLSDQLKLSIVDHNDSIFIGIFEELKSDSFEMTSKYFDHFPATVKHDANTTTIIGLDSLASNSGNFHIRFQNSQDSLELEIHSETSDDLFIFPDDSAKTGLTTWMKSSELTRYEHDDKSDNVNIQKKGISVSAKNDEESKSFEIETNSVFSRRYSDDILIKYQEKLISMNLPNDFKIIDKKVGQEEKDDSSLSRFPGFFDGLYQTQFYNFQPYLLKKIFPSLFLSSSLFGLLCMSFFILFRNWRKQEQLITIKNDFISNMTHELKTPISTVGVALEALSKFGASNDPEKVSEYIDISKHELNRLNILVDKVLKMSAYDKEENVMNFSEVKVDDLTRTVMNSMRLHFEKHHVVTEIDIQEGDFRISGDRVHLTNVIYNVLDNAIKYSTEDAKLGIKLSHEGNDIVIRIVDNGIGIPSEYRDKVFDRFFRVPNDDVHNVKGYGLGLNYVKDIIEKHKGSVRIESTQNVGTEVIIKLPS